MGVSFLVGGSGSFRVPCLRNKCYGMLFRYATFVICAHYTHGGNNSQKALYAILSAQKSLPA